MGFLLWLQRKVVRVRMVWPVAFAEPVSTRARSLGIPTRVMALRLVTRGSSGPRARRAAEGGAVVGNESLLSRGDANANYWN